LILAEVFAHSKSLKCLDIYVDVSEVRFHFIFTVEVTLKSAIFVLLNFKKGPLEKQCNYLIFMLDLGFRLFECLTTLKYFSPKLKIEAA
jgi:hypothetical protein